MAPPGQLSVHDISARAAPRVHCKKHGVRRVRLPWAEEKAQFTALFGRLAIDVMLACDILRASRILQISWDEAWPIMERAVERGLKAKKKRQVKQIGVDEKTAGRGHDYVTVVNDLGRATVEHVEDGRKKESLDAYFIKVSRREMSGFLDRNTCGLTRERIFHQDINNDLRV